MGEVMWGFSWNDIRFPTLLLQSALVEVLFAVFLCVPTVIIISLNSVAAVLDDVTIAVQCLIEWPLGNLSCMLSTGDGHVIDLNNLEG